MQSDAMHMCILSDQKIIFYVSWPLCELDLLFIDETMLNSDLSQTFLVRALLDLKAIS